MSSVNIGALLGPRIALTGPIVLGVADIVGDTAGASIGAGLAMAIPLARDSVTTGASRPARVTDATAVDQRGHALRQSSDAPEARPR